MADIRGTTGADFIHRRGDGLSVPSRLNEVIGVTRDGDLLSGLAGNDVIHGDAGDDTILGGGGADRMFGGDGNDRYFVDVAGDAVTERAGAGNDRVYSLVDYTLGANVETLRLIGTAGNSGTGNGLGNRILGNDAANQLAGAGGDDVLVGGLGNDTLRGGDGNDAVWGNEGNDTIVGGDGNDTLGGEVGQNRMVGGLGDDTYLVGAARNTLVEGAGAGVDLVISDADHTLGANLDNLTLRGADSLSGTGNGLDNVIRGNAGSNLLRGLNGNDTLFAGNGADTLDGGQGADSMTGGAGGDTYVVDDAGDVVSEKVAKGPADTVQSQLNAYALGAQVEDLEFTGTGDFEGSGNGLDNGITGGAGDDRLRGLAGNDTLLGGNGDDTLDGGQGADRMTGGNGGDTYVVNDAGDVVNEKSGKGAPDLVQSQLNAYTLGGQVENLEFTGAGDFSGNGNTLDNRITGGAGDDTLNGRGGADTLIGGAGNDTYGIDEVGEVVTEEASGGTDTIRTLLDSYTLGNHLENLEYTGTGDFAGTGNDLDNRTTGGAGNDTLRGLAGNDTLLGGNGDDTLNGGLGTGRMTGGNGGDTYVVNDAGDVVNEKSGKGAPDLVQSQLNAYTLGAQVENLEFTGAGDFTGNGNTLDNRITGGAGDDTLNGRGGADTLIGGRGDDTYGVDDASEIVTEASGEGEDLIRTLLRTYTLGANLEDLEFTGTGRFTGTGNGLSNQITGGLENDRLFGLAGADGLYGGLGDDTLDGGAGADFMSGDEGDDTYVVDNANDSIQELANGGQDDLVLARLNSYTLGANVENLQFDGGGNFTGRGNGLGNQIVGGGGSDTLFGLAGSDTLFGGAGSDSLDGGAGADLLSGDAGDDTYVVDDANDMIQEAVSGGQSDLVLARLNSYSLGANLENLQFDGNGDFIGRGNNLNNQIVGGAGSDALSGLGGSDDLYGGAGDDTLDGGLGADFLSGDAGNDTYVVDNVQDVIQELASGGRADVVLARVNSYTLGANVEDLQFDGTGDFTGNGNAGANRITGGSGDDTLNGRGGADTLIGGRGDDTYGVDDASEVVTEAAGEGEDLIRTSLNAFTLAANFENLAFSGTGTFAGRGNDAANQITGGAGNDSLLGLAGNDALFGGGGNDTLMGGIGADFMSGDAGNDRFFVDNAGDTIQELSGGGDGDTVLSQLRSYTLTAQVENLTAAVLGDFTGTGNNLANVILAANGNDTLSGRAGNDTLQSSRGNDVLDGGIGDDEMTGGAGNDTYVVDSLGDVVIEGPTAGNDTVRTDLSGYTLSVGVENLVYTGSGAFSGIGNASANSITGGAGADTLDGSSGNDTIDGGAGSDRILVGNGADTFLFTSLGGSDRLVGTMGLEDSIAFDMSEMPIGDGDTVVENVGFANTGGRTWDSANEVVLLTGVRSFDDAGVADAMSRTAGNVTAGTTQLFVVASGGETGVYRHVSNGTRTVLEADLDLIFSVSSTDVRNFSFETETVFVA